MNRRPRLVAAWVLGFGIAGGVLSAFTINETTDYPNGASANAAAIATLDQGSNTVSGGISGSCNIGDCNPFPSTGDTQDSFNLTVPAGFEVTSYTVSTSNWTGPAGFSATTSVARVIGSSPTASFQNPAVIPTSFLVANGTTANLVTTPLAPGNYGISLWGQGASAAGPFSLNYTVTIVLGVHDSTHCVNPGGTGGCFSNVQSAINAAFSGDDIDIAAGTYSVASCTVNSGNQSPFFITINKNLTIHGAGAGSTVLSGGCRVITVGAVTVTISGVTVTGGAESLGFGGGGVRNDGGALTITDSVIAGNSSTGSGGGFQQTGGSSIFQNVVFESNTAGLGAALRTGGGSASLTDVTIRNNTAGDGHALLDTSGALTLNRVTLNGNTGTNIDDAAIALGPGGSATLTNVTVSGNNRHGLLANSATAAPRNVVLNNVTIDGNSGIGIYQFDGDDVITVKNSIVSNNAGGDCLGSIVSGDYNLFETTSGCTITGTTTNNLGVDPDLAPLASNGGLTQTKALCSGPGSPSGCTAESVAINAGSPLTPGSGGGACEAIDQRGVTRPQDHNGNETFICDMGAFEAPGESPGPADQTIAVDPAAPASAAFESTFDVAATATSGLAVAITTTGGCSGGGSGSATITMTSGTTACVVEYNQAGDAEYNPAPEVTSNTNATPASQTITVTQSAPESAVFNSTFDVTATASSGLTVDISTSGGCDGLGSGTATITVGSDTTACVVHYNQLGSDDYSAADEVTETTNPIPPGPTIAITDVTIVEGNSGSKNGIFTASLSAASAQTVTVTYATAPDTASAGSDYTAVSGLVTFAPGVVTRTVTIPVLGDLIDEVNETFFVNLSAPTNASIADGQGLGTITDNDTSSLKILDLAVAEGDGGSVAAVFTVSLTVPNSRTVTVDYTTGTTGSAQSGVDYQPTAGTLTFTPGVTSQTVSVLVNGDTLDEANETFVVTLANATEAPIARGSAKGTITDDDPAPTLSIADLVIVEGNSSTKDAIFTVTLSAASGQKVKVNYQTADDTAVAPGDYTAKSGTLAFNAGVTSLTIKVKVVGELVAEADETFFVNLTSPQQATIVDGQAVATIVDNEP